MQRLLRISVVLTIAVLVLTFLWFPAVSPLAHAAFPGTNGGIAFQTTRNGNSEIFTMNPDGTGQTNLTNSTTAGDFNPEWSPDSTKIVFESNRAGTANHQIFVMNADGSGVTRLTNNTSFDENPDWSPDGTKIVFSRDLGTGVEIFVMNADGSGQTQLTFSGAENDSPKWSPDGTKIAFSRQPIPDPSGVREIFSMNPDGTGQTNLTNNGGFNTLPDWSPDGTKIAYTNGAGFCAAACNIFVMNANGTNQTNITNSTFNNAAAAWSPDGIKLTFQSNRDTALGQIYTMNSDGSGVTRLTFNSAADSRADWGSARAVCHENDGNGDMHGNKGGVAHLKQDQDQCEDQTDNDQDQATDQADNIQFNDPGANVNFVSGRINSITFNGPAHSVTITGTGTNAGHLVSFTVVAVSTTLHTPGFFSISLSDGYVNSGNLLSGVIEVS